MSSERRGGWHGDRLTVLSLVSAQAEEDKDEEATEEGNMSTAAGNALSFLPKLW